MNHQEKPGKTKQSQLLLWLAFLLALFAPIGLYFSLNAEVNLLPIVFFSLIVLSMGLTAWKG